MNAVSGSDTAPPQAVVEAGEFPFQAILGFFAAPRRRSPARVVARRLLPVAIGLPIMAAWLHLEAEQARWFETGGGIELFATALVLIFAGLVWWMVGTIDRADAERRQAEHELRDVNRALQMLSQGNQALLHATSEAGLLSEICTVLVKEGGYSLAWVGYAESDEAKTVRPVAQAGVEKAYLENLKLTWADTARGRGPTGRAIRTGRTTVCRSTMSDPDFAPWRKEALKRGFSSSIAIPLAANDRTFGALMIYSRTTDTFGPQEARLLQELAADIAFGLESLRTRTAHQRAEAALRQSEAELKEAQRLARVGSWHLDTVTNQVTWSEELYLMLGLPPDSPSPPYPEHQRLFTAESWQRLSAALPRTRETGIPYELELETVRPDGSRGWMLARGEPLRDAQGAVIGLRGVAQDITERKHADERLRHLTAVLRAVRNVNQLITHEKDRDVLLRQSCAMLTDARGYGTAWIALHGPQGRITLAAESGFGAAITPLRAHLAHGEWPACCQQALTSSKPVLALKQDPGCLACPLAPVHPDAATLAVALGHGDRIYGALVVSLPAAMAADEQEQSLLRELAEDVGFALHTIGTEQERKHAEAERERLAMAIDQASEMVVVTDTDACIQYVNPAFTAITGYTREDVCGLNPRVLKSGLHDAAFYQHLWGTLLAGQTWRGRLVNKRKDGTLYTEDVAISPVRNTAGTTVNYVAVKRDVTRELALEAQLIQSQKLEAIGTLASGVAHEINNPIMGIMGFTQLIQDKWGDRDAELADFAAEIGKETERVATIVKNLLSFARFEKHTSSPARMCDIVEGTLSLILAVLRHDQVALDVSVPASLPQIRCRTQQIQQVLMNLLTNARDALNQKYPAHDPDKKVTIEARQIEKGGRQWIRTTVQDHGSGIPPDLRERIFDPFFTTKPRDKGTGLGLSISHGIVKDHGGSLTVESEVGNWTRFHLDLPVMESS